MARPGEAEALERLRGVLAGPEFQPRPRPPWERAFAALQEWVGDLLVDLLDGVPDALLGRLGWLQWLIVLLALAALVALVAFVSRAVGLSVSRDARLRAAEAARLRARSDALWREGQELGRAARYGQATRALYLAALYALEEHGFVAVDEGQTNLEHARRAVRVGPELADVFARLVDRYDRLRYGGGETARADFEAVAELAARTRAVRPPAPAAPSGRAVTTAVAP